MKKIYTFSCLIFAMLATFKVYTQTPQKIWDRTFGGSGTQNGQSVIKTSDGGYIMVGLSSSNSSGSKSEDSEGGEDYWIVKVDSYGYSSWDRTIGGSEDDFARSVVATYDGGCIVVGTSSSDISGSKSEDSFGLDDYWVVKLDADGNVEWDKTIGGDDADKVNSIIQLVDGDFAIIGYSKSGISGNKTQANQGSEDYWIIKISSAGVIQWDKTYGGNSYDYATSASTNFDGNIVIAGYSYSGISGNKTEESRGQYDYWVIKIDASGNLLWDKTIGGADFDFATCLAQAYDGGYVIAGFSSSNFSGEKSQNSKGGDDYWVVKLSNAGAFVWDRTIGGSLNDFAFSLDATYYGDYIIGGSSSSGISGNKTEASKGGSDYWILRLGGSGFPLWDKTIGGSGNDYFAKLFLEDDLTYITLGTSNSPVSGDKSQANYGVNDYWLVKLQSCPIIFSPTVTSPTICYGTSTSITATSCSQGSPVWYDNTTTVLLYSGSTFTTPSLTTNTIYQVRCETSGLPYCKSSFSNVSITVNSLVGNASTSNPTINANTSTTLSAGCISSTPNWYSTSTSSNLLGTGTYTTPVLTTTTTYYVSCETGGTPNCVSNTRTPQTVNVNQSTFDSATSGNWNATSTWVCSCIPNGTLPVRIMSTHNVTVPTAYIGQAKGLRFISTGKVTLQGTGKVNVIN
jgi:hypothetical protein